MFSECFVTWGLVAGLVAGLLARFEMFSGRVSGRLSGRCCGVFGSGGAGWSCPFVVVIVSAICAGCELLRARYDPRSIHTHSLPKPS